VDPTAVITKRVEDALKKVERALKTMGRRPKRNKGASSAAIDAIAKAWGIDDVPASYRAFLMLTDGFVDRAREPTVLALWSAKELGAGAGAARPSSMMREAKEWKTADPDCAEAIRGFVIGMVLDRYTLFDPIGRTREHEMAVVTIDSEREVTRHENFIAYLDSNAAGAEEEKRSNDWAKASFHREKELTALGATWESVMQHAFSPDGKLLAVLSFAEVHIFDLENLTTQKDGTTYAPWLFHTSKDNTPTWDPQKNEEILFTADGRGVARRIAGDDATFAFDLTANGAAFAFREASRDWVAGVESSRWTPSHRFRRRDGVKLTKK